VGALDVTRSGAFKFKAPAVEKANGAGGSIRPAGVGAGKSPMAQSPAWIQFARSWLLPQVGSGRSRTTGAARREFDVVMAWSVDRLGLIGFLSEIHAVGSPLHDAAIKVDEVIELRSPGSLPC
jgi:hypothetical protein